MRRVVSYSEVRGLGVIWNFIFILTPYSCTRPTGCVEGWMPHFNDDDEHGCAIEEDDTDTDATIDDDDDDGLRRTKAK